MTGPPHDESDAIRRPERDIRQREYRAVTLLLVFAVLTLAFETALDYPELFSETSVPAVPGLHHYQKFVLRLMVVISFLAYGLYTSRILIEVRRAENDLLESENRYRQLTQNSLTGIYILQDGKFVFVNDRFCAITGYSAEELLDRPVWQYFHPDDRNLVMNRAASCFLGQSLSPQYETRLRCKDGATKWVEVLATTILHMGRNAEMGNLADITERKLAEQDRERLVEDLTAAKEKLRFEATHDGLTGLLNRTAILERLSAEIARSARDKGPVAVIMADLDHFKRVNDSHGHLVGDAVLVEVARRIVASVRPYDMVGRYGGEEILIVLPGCDESAAVACAQRVREAVGNPPVRTNRHEVRITMSLGLASLDDADDNNLDAIINAADSALYRAKEFGRNCVMGKEL
jgi:diguanylate cyclase (GGDEF)-like protein/PAS domain S-box-containing protein